MSNPTTPDTNRPIALAVGDDDRETFLRSLFGYEHFLVGENAIYNFMGWLSPQDYGGGYWEFYALDGGPLYMVPPEKDQYRITCDTNGYHGTASSDAAGIIVTLFALSHLSFQFESERLSEAFQRLHEYAASHPEAATIFGAID
jgi:hypothetical protein